MAVAVAVAMAVDVAAVFVFVAAVEACVPNVGLDSDKKLNVYQTNDHKQHCGSTLVLKKHTREQTVCLYPRAGQSMFSKN